MHVLAVTNLRAVKRLYEVNIGQNFKNIKILLEKDIRLE